MTSPREAIERGETTLGIEFGSTTIKACLIRADDLSVLAVGACDWESHLVDGVWTHDDAAIWSGLQDAYARLAAAVRRSHGVELREVGAIGISAMMHGYLALGADDQPLVPFRTWRNTATSAAAAELTEALGAKIPVRWSIAHLHHAVRAEEPHLARLHRLTTLAGYVHHRLTGRHALGVGDASGMFPVDLEALDWDQDLVNRYERMAGPGLPRPLRALLPDVLSAGHDAGALTDHGARLLDPSGALAPGALACPPEGDASTGMVATGAMEPGSASVSVGTSIFASFVLDAALPSVHSEIDVVATPFGDPVAMVHCNNGASEIASWVSTYARFATCIGVEISLDDAFAIFLTEALEGSDDAGGIVAFNFRAAEPVARVDAGRPLLVRPADAPLTLADLARAQVYGMLASLALGMEVLRTHDVRVDRVLAHGGVFRTSGVAQRFLAAAVGAPVSIAPTASMGGAWGIAILATLTRRDARAVRSALRLTVAPESGRSAIAPRSDDALGFATYLSRFRADLALQRPPCPAPTNPTTP